MQKKIKICIKNHEFIVKLRNTETAKKIRNSLPLTSQVHTWGEEIYFFVPVSCALENDSKNIVNLGEIAFWTNGKAIAIGFGRTPISMGDEIRLADKCNIFGDTDYNLKKLNDVKPGEMVLIKKC